MWLIGKACCNASWEWYVCVSGLHLYSSDLGPTELREVF